MEKSLTSNPIESSILRSKTEELDTSTLMLHVYHHNKEKPKNYVIHTLRDSLTPITTLKELKKKKKESQTDQEKIAAAVVPQAQKPDEHPLNDEVVREDPPKPSRWQKFCKQAARAQVYDKAKHDPRSHPDTPHPSCESYFLHLPLLYGHGPPYTLRRGGHKRSPVQCLMASRSFWQEWKLEFGDILAQEGVIDGRGVVNWRVGTKGGKDGTLKGYKERNRRWWGESGKKWFYEQREAGHKCPDVPEKAKPEEVVNVRWVSPLVRPREYRFTWRGFVFIWKGSNTIDVQQKRFTRLSRVMTRFNHLKLVVNLPRGNAGQDPEKACDVELVLARYTSAMSKRKAGRLEIFQDAIDSFIADHAGHLSLPSVPGVTETPAEDLSLMGIKEKKVEVEPSSCDPFLDPRISNDAPIGFDEQKTQQRLKDLVVASGMCMIIGEFEKRQWLWEIILLIIDIADNAG
ncbi:hypothetical protein BJ875DRAFT_476483 [Amylocarpus encephaloides]|uniref:Uncharacterized protein n=1 Tax=Amylocarpus encephaloides TaxID=45428 RepID=A0A9P7Y9E0_9HELO|nr:hypothetical protein BJ875DRAFT_476483 [Amylocarpus encephaloides]